ncbi:MAG: ABC transporter ATP-binding protein [Candidatus Liberibacter europaeus]|uniref:ABC transporter ATP-binding protein n=1 Tax=Candidatus Liberibacter europaeus TaxID=744859 RepID=A0A2T4VX66_9HYPH|nr:ABC transporter ATP-binding protein [Candidatus Liberibacter europaeus]PTL86375.1 MAG: ABC transporter ATP-binding protein [Candidatus Liberibacter europaeus]
MSEKDVLILQNIKHSYANVRSTSTVLENVNISLKRGEMVALVSPSGTGKSTILHIAGLLEVPTEGNVIVDGQLCNKLTDEKKSFLRCTKIGFVYQAHRLLTDFSVIENIILPQIIAGTSYEVARRRAIDVLEYMRIDHYADRRSSDISGGEQQRVAICRAIANAPLILLADEPTGNLDPKTAMQVFEVLKDLVIHFGLSALIATHNIEIASLMDRKVTIKNGIIFDL